jgi:antitoxin (DNA-binding transcriptional repressor) of toxin-antitoxin stability system
MAQEGTEVLVMRHGKGVARLCACVHKKEEKKEKCTQFNPMPKSKSLK